MAIAFTRWPIFKIFSFFEHFVFFGAFFAQNNSKVLVKWLLECFYHFKFLTQTDHFAKAWAIAFTRWPIFKMVLFLEYLVFFGAVFFTEQL